MKLKRAIVIGCVCGATYFFGLLLNGRGLVGVPQFSAEVGRNDWASMAVARARMELAPSATDASAESLAHFLADSLGSEWSVESFASESPRVVMLKRPGESRDGEIRQIDDLLASSGWKAETMTAPEVRMDFRAYRRRGQMLFLGAEYLDKSVAYVLFMHGSADANTR